MQCPPPELSFPLKDVEMKPALVSEAVIQVLLKTILSSKIHYFQETELMNCLKKEAMAKIGIHSESGRPFFLILFEIEPFIKTIPVKGVGANAEAQYTLAEI